VIIGIGTDLTEIARVRKLLEEPAIGLRFMQRVLTPAELEMAQARQGRKPEYVAGRFAAKEAVAKALGFGIGRQVGFQDIEVIPDAAGRPECRVSPAALERLGLTPAAVRLHLSITHSDTTAGAFAVAEWV
jgi:holo-[acyl-carrier protein] synthase